MEGTYAVRSATNVITTMKKWERGRCGTIERTRKKRGRRFRREIERAVTNRIETKAKRLRRFLGSLRDSTEGMLNDEISISFSNGIVKKIL